MSSSKQGQNRSVMFRNVANLEYVRTIVINKDNIDKKLRTDSARGVIFTVLFINFFFQYAIWKHKNYLCLSLYVVSFSYFFACETYLFKLQKEHTSRFWVI